MANDSSDNQELDKWLEKLFQCKSLPEEDVKALCLKAREVLSKEANVQPVSSPVTLVGDIHGQWYDLIEMFAIGGSRTTQGSPACPHLSSPEY